VRLSTSMLLLHVCWDARRAKLNVLFMTCWTRDVGALSFLTSMLFCE